MKPLKIVPANDTFGALNLMLEIIEAEAAGFISEPEVNGQGADVINIPVKVADDIGLIVQSSGSTGEPKRIELSAEAIIHSARASMTRLGGPGQWLLALPVNYIAGANVLARSVLSDTQPVMMNTLMPFTAEAFVRGASLMEGSRRYTSLVPAQLRRLVEAIDDAFVFSMLSKFDAILVGGQSPNWADVEQLRSRGINVVVTYGATETCGGCIYDGQPLEGVDFRLDGGLISISGPPLANDVGDWFQTNDLGELVDGRLEILGRADRVIISGGMKVSLERVEELATQIAGVEQAVAVGIESQWGQSVGIVFTGSPEVSFASLEQSISVAARPAKTLRVEQLPTLNSGKPDLLACGELLSD